MRSTTGGYALTAVLLLALTIGTLLLVRGVNSNFRSEQHNEVQTNQALSAAKDALIAYAQAEDNTPGALPCPATPTGAVVSDCSTSNKAFPSTGSPIKIIGRIPWKTLGIDTPKDGNGDCIWMLLYTPMRNNVATTNRSSFPINSSTFSDRNATQGIWFNGQAYPAVLVSPPQAKPDQTRTWVTDNACSTGELSAYFDAPTSEQSTAVEQLSGVLPISVNDLLRPTLKRVLEPLSLSCARTLIASHPTSGSIADIRDSDLEKSSLVDMFDLAIGGCDQIDKCAKILSDYGFNLYAYDPKNENGLSEEDKDIIRGWCSLYRDKSGKTLTAGTCPAQTKSADRSLTTPPFWLCHNKWLEHIYYDKDKNTLSASLNSAPPFACSAHLLTGVIECK